MDIIERLNWRYATKAMTAEKVPQEKVDRILEAARLAPSSSGLQPYEIIVITNDELKEKIKALAWNQEQVTSCSHLLIFAAWDTYTPERINEFFDRSISERGFSNEGLENYRQRLLSSYPLRPAEENFNHAAKQAYISFGLAIAAAAFENIDATPMEGFDPAALDELLGFRQKGLRSCLLLPLGYRDTKNDWLLPLKKIRRSKENFITTIK